MHVHGPRSAATAIRLPARLMPHCAMVQEDIKLEPLDPEHVADLAGMWRSYFVAAFVRNPFQRAVSAYHMLARNLDPAGPAAQAYDWNTFCADPAGFLDLCKQDAKCNS